MVNDTTGNRSTASLRQALRAFAVAPLAGLAILVVVEVWGVANPNAYPFPPRVSVADILLLVPFLALRIGPFCYGAAAAFVLPGLLIWPSLRKPSYSVAGSWGFCATWAAILTLAVIFDRESLSRIRLPQMLPVIGPLVLFGITGALSGVLYSWLVRRQSIRSEQGERNSM
jgi:hypothetical protein